MPNSCRVPGCKEPVPENLSGETRCLLHFLILLENACDDLRRETALGTLTAERSVEIARYIADQGEKLARISMGSSTRIADDRKHRVLNLFLTLINLRENLERAAQRAQARTNTAVR